MDFQKKDWQFRDIISENELNRMEDGIEEGITKAEQAQDTADNAQNAIDNHIAATTGVHGATSAATPNTIVQRDSAGRFKAAAPSAPDDVARKDTVDSAISSHVAATDPHTGYVKVDGSRAMTGVLTVPGVYPTITPKAETDPGESYPQGITIFSVGAESGWTPNNGFGTVVTIKESAIRMSQLFFDHGQSGPNGMWFRHYYSGVGWTNWSSVWNDRNDGAGSGLDADLLDGMQPSTSASANTIAQRDSSGRIKAAAPSASDDVARKAEVDTIQSSLTSHIADFVRHPGYAVTGGSGNAYTVTLSPAPSAYTDGMGVAIKANRDNTGPATLNVNGLGAKAIKKPNGNDVAAGNLKSGSIYTLRYNANTGNFILQGEGGSGNAQPSDVLSGKTFTNDSGEQTGTMPNRGNVSATLTSQGQEYTIQQGYHAGSGKVTANITNLNAGNIKYGATVGGIAGTFSQTANGATAAQILSGRQAAVNGTMITGTMPDRSGNTAALSSAVSGNTLRLLASEGYRDGVNDFVTITDNDWIPENIRAGINIFGKIGTLDPIRTASGTASTISGGTGSYAHYRDIEVTGLTFRPKAFYAAVQHSRTWFSACYEYGSTRRGFSAYTDGSDNIYSFTNANFRITPSGSTYTVRIRVAADSNVPLGTQVIWEAVG